MKIPANAWVVVADGQKALFLKNIGSAIEPTLHLIEKEALDNPPTHEQGTDRPGRHPGRGAGVSGVEQTDWHAFEKEQFAHEIAARLDKGIAADAFDGFILIAPAATLGELRSTLAPATSAALRAEIEKDLTKHTIDAILGLIDDFEG